MTAIIPIPAFADNYIWLSTAATRCSREAAGGCSRARRQMLKRDRGEPTVPSTIAEECATNPFLRIDEPAVRAAAELHAGRRLGDRVAVFAEVRACKNAF